MHKTKTALPVYDAEEIRESIQAIKNKKGKYTSQKAMKKWLKSIIAGKPETAPKADIILG